VNECPLIRFLGRQSYISDWFGEKLNEAHVSGILSDVFQRLNLSPVFAMVACEPDRPTPGYVLYIESSVPTDFLHRAAARIEQRLRENFHYNYARRIGQLSALRVFRTRGATEAFLSAKSQSGQRSGAIKQIALDNRSGWSRIFRGEFVGEIASGAVAQ
jgi:hypothetical protein